MIKKGVLSVLLFLLMVSCAWAVTGTTTNAKLPKPPLGATGTADGYGTLMDSADAAIWAHTPWITVGDAGYATFAAAVATLNAVGTPCTLRVPSTVTETISADLTVNSNISVVIDKGAVLTIGTVALTGTATYADTADGGTINWDGTTLTFSADQHGNIYTRRMGAGFIKNTVTGERRRLAKLLGIGTTATLLSGFTGTWSDNEAWAYSTNILTGLTTIGGTDQLVPGDVITSNSEVFLIASVGATSVHVDHHPLAEFATQAVTRYRRLIFNGPVSIGNHQAFAGYGVSFNGNAVCEVKPEWFGASGQYNPDYSPSVNHDDSVAIQAAEYAAAWVTDSSGQAYVNLYNKRVLLSSHYKVTKTIFMTADTWGLSERGSVIHTTINDGSPTLIYDFEGVGSTNLTYWGRDFRDYTVSGAAANNTVAHLVGMVINSKFVNLFSELTKYGIISWENWKNRFDVDIKNCGYGITVSLGGANNDWSGSIEQCTSVGIDFSYGCKWGALNSGSMNFLIEGDYTTIPFQIGQISNCPNINIYCEMGGGTAQAYIGGSYAGSETLGTKFNLFGSGVNVNADWLKDCDLSKCNFPIIWGAAAAGSVDGSNKKPLGAVVNGYNMRDALRKYPYSMVLNPPINLFPNPFFKYALRGFKAITTNQATVSLASGNYLEHLNGGGMKVLCTAGQSGNYADFEMTPAVVAAMQPDSNQPYQEGYTIGFWYFIPSGYHAGLVPGMSLLYSNDGGHTWTDCGLQGVTNDSSATTKGGWAWQQINPVWPNFSTKPLEFYSLPVTNIKIRFYGNVTGTNATNANDYVIFGGVYYGRHVQDSSILMECRWGTTSEAGIQIGQNLIFPINKYYLTSQTIAIDATAKTLTRGSGSWITDGVRVGDSIALTGCTTGANNTNYIISDITALVLTWTTGGTTTEAGTGTQTVALNVCTDTAQTYIQGDEWRNQIPITGSLVPGGVCITGGAGGTATWKNHAALITFTAALPSGSTPSLAAADSFTDSQTADLTSPPIVSAVGTRKIIFFTAARAVRFDTSTTLKGNNSASWTTAAGAWMELNSDGTYWRCAIHNAD